MSQTMQARFLAAAEEIIEDAGFDAVVNFAFSNTGTVQAMDGFRTVGYWSFDFQHLYGTFQPTQTGDRDASRGGYFRYDDEAGIEAALDFVRRAVEAAAAA